MYPEIYRALRLLWPGGRETRRNLRELERTQWLSPAQLEALQLRRIQRVVRYAYEHVPFYRERYQGAGIHPDDIRSLDDLQVLPFLTREDVNNHLDMLVSTAFRGKLHAGATGGSTGQPMRFFVDDSFWWWNAALEFRGRGWYGVHEGDKMAWVWGAPQEVPDWSLKKRLKTRLMRQRYLNTFSMTEAKMQAFAEMLVRWQPAMFRANVSGLTLLAEFMRERAITGILPRLIETTTEPLTNPQGKLLQEVFHSPVADCYSGREFGTIAYRCEMGGLHVCETRYLEIVANGEVVPGGRMGEVAVTSLTQFAMPFIRYKNDDAAVYEVDTCPCGRGLPVLREVVGRKQDILTTADGQLVHGGFFSYLFMVRPEILRFQVYQPERKRLQVRLVCKQDVGSAWLQDVRDSIQARFGESMDVSLQVVDRIELTPAGKHRFTISEVKPEFAG